MPKVTARIFILGIVLIAGCGVADTTSSSDGDTPSSCRSADQSECNPAPLCVNLYDGSRSLTIDQVRNQIIETNINGPTYTGSGSGGKLARWRTPIDVYTGGIKRFDDAISHIESRTKGLITFNKVSSPPANGIHMVEGTALNQDGFIGCGNTDDSNPPDGLLIYKIDNSGFISGLYYTHIGSTKCDDQGAGLYASAISEHELFHILGLDSHFDGFRGWEGIDDDLARATLMNIYQNKAGESVGELQICSY